MKLKHTLLITGATLITTAWTAGAGLAYDQNVTPDILFGSGNGNGAFTVNTQNNVELGLRAKLRGLGVYNSNGDGSYTFQAGSPSGWNFEWSINTAVNGTAGYYLDDLTYVLSIDNDPSAGISYGYSFDPINGINPGTGTVLWDHGIGNNSTANGAGDNDAGRTVATYADLIANNNVAQNSWRERWFGIDPNAGGSYNIKLEAFDGSRSVGMTEINVNVNAAVPEPSTWAAGALLLLPFGVSTLRMLRKGRKA